MPVSDSRVPAVRKSLTAQLDELFKDDAGEIYVKDLTEKELDELDALDIATEESKQFRVGAKSTIWRQDMHLLDFRRVMIVQAKRQDALGQLVTEDPASDANDEIFFAPDRFLDHSRLYLIHCVRNTRPRRLRDQRPGIAAIMARRSSMCFWMHKKMEEPVPSWKFMAATDQAIQYAAAKFGISKARERKRYFGRFELRELIDFDMARTLNVPLAEVHHLAWCLGCVCGVRPGSMGWATRREDQYLQWKDVEIVRSTGAHKGMFTTKITFRHLKRGRDNMSYANGLAMTIMPPMDPSNIPLSATYRMLIMLLRRGLLRDYTTPEELFGGDDVHIRIKDDALDLPILVSGTPRGLGVTDKPLSSQNLSQYLMLRGRRCGYGEHCTMYAWRNQAGNQVHHATDRDTARLFMGHTPESRTYEKYYERREYHLDVSRIALG